ncbi:curli production assembly/transport component CsgF [Hymenobacter mucosus]|uniref:Curli production assembly/transport component CsgF n=1 Tax=Hymenobacter mucosus TaxID=1411120 RepID=A0A238ZB97_9BACT|nr:curli production assembly/transport component CsgF [Hymenobacter mucosus]SNR80248.1 curli production assembly/transport component CsgF [Hymenobacter mucosus]
MKTTVLLPFFAALVAVLGWHPAAAQDLIYRPVNPAFGGDSFNYQWLQSSAQAQNSTKDPNAPQAPAQLDPLQQFQQSLNQQILGQLAQRLVGNQFGTGADPLRPGNYSVGTYQIGVNPNGTGFSINILDTSTGNQTTITIPGL